ncbi:MAG: ROK family transcriptional regulator [Anaerolineales bacterium]|nr:ROK family transcriptional regulator [Anaerolineales bacterium]
MLTMRAGSKYLIREINQALVLDIVRSHGALSRTEIAVQANLSLPTVSGITAQLIEMGLVYEQSTGASTGGRRPVLVAFNPRAGYVVGVKLTETTAITVLTDLSASVVAHHRAPIVAHQPEAIIASIVHAVDALAGAANGAPILGVGMGMASVVDRRREVVRFATYFGWHELPLAQMLEERLNIPVVVDNDVNALAVAEQWFGAGRGVTDFLVISLGRGIGLGMILNGRLYRGAGGGAGEFGHINVQADGPLCDCGKHGCLEAYVSDPALARQASAALGREVRPAEVYPLAVQGDPQVIAIYRNAGRILGTAVANLVNVLNPARIIIGGEGAVAGHLILPTFEQALNDTCFGGLRDDVTIVTEPWGDDGWARGAASLLLGELFQPVLHREEKERVTLTGAEVTTGRQGDRRLGGDEGDRRDWERETGRQR